MKLYSYLLISSQYPVIISDFLGGASAGRAGLQRGVEGGGPAALLVYHALHQVHPAQLVLVKHAKLVLVHPAKLVLVKHAQLVLVKHVPPQETPGLGGDGVV